MRKLKEINVNDSSVCSTGEELYIAFNSGFFDKQIKKGLKILHKKGLLNEIFDVDTLNKLFYKKEKNHEELKNMKVIENNFYKIFSFLDDETKEKKYKLNINRKVFVDFFAILTADNRNKLIDVSNLVKERIDYNISNVNYIFTNINQEGVLDYLQVLFREEKFDEINNIISKIDKFTDNYGNKGGCNVFGCYVTNEYFGKIKKTILESIGNLANFKNLSKKSLKVLDFFNKDGFRTNISYIKFNNLGEVFEIFGIYEEDNPNGTAHIKNYINQINLEPIKFFDYLVNLVEKYDKDFVESILKFLGKKNILDIEKFKTDYSNIYKNGYFDIPYNYSSGAEQIRKIEFEKYLIK